MFAGWLRIGAMLFLHECFYNDDVCIECGICFYNRYWYFRFGDLQYTVYAPLLRQVYKGIILCMIPSLDFYFLALMIYSVGWILFICVKTKWKWQSLQLCLHLHSGVSYWGRHVETIDDGSGPHIVGNSTSWSEWMPTGVHSSDTGIRKEK
jgi:hypothetical protein